MAANFELIRKQIFAPESAVNNDRKNLKLNTTRNGKPEHLIRSILSDIQQPWKTSDQYSSRIKTDQTTASLWKDYDHILVELRFVVMRCESSRLKK